MDGKTLGGIALLVAMTLVVFALISGARPKEITLPGGTSIVLDYDKGKSSPGQGSGASDTGKVSSSQQPKDGSSTGSSENPRPVATPSTSSLPKREGTAEASQPKVVQQQASLQATPKLREDIAEIRQRYYQWLDAWQSRDIDAYMSFYSPNLVQKRAGKASYGYAELRARMVGMWAKQSFISINSSPPSIRFEGPIALLEAYQDYDSSTWWDRGTKRMVWRKEEGVWRVVGESFLRRAGGRRR